jgi:hypothetical protein
MSSHRRRATTIIAPLIVVVVIAAALGVPFSSASPRHATSQRSLTATAHKGTSATAPAGIAQLGRAFRIFGVSHHAHSAAASAQPLPANVAEAMSHESPISSAEVGLDPGGARFVGGTYPAWVVPGTNGVCIVSSGVVGPGVADSVCGTTAVADAGRLAKVSATPAGVPVVVGLAPNGNTAVTVDETTGSRREVPVVNNAYEIVGGAPGTVSLRGTSGASTTESVAATPPAP